MILKKSMGGRVNIMNYYLPQRHITVKHDISATKVHICLNVLRLFLTKVNNLRWLMVVTKSSILDVGYFIKDQWGVALIS